MGAHISYGNMKNEDAYHVVFRDVAGTLTRSAFRSQKGFDSWYRRTTRDGTNTHLRHVLRVVAQGITNEDAAQLVKTPKSTANILGAVRKQVHRHFLAPSRSLTAG